MRVLLTGATGFLGSHIAESLSKAGHPTLCFIRSTSNYRFLNSLPNVEFISGNLTDTKVLQKAVSDVEVIIHNAGLTTSCHMDELYRVNVDATQCLLDVAKHHSPRLKRFIYISSLAAVGPSSREQPHSDPSSVLNPVSHYGLSKKAAEAIVLRHKDSFPVTIIRPPAIYGPRDKNIFLFFKTLKKGFTFKLAGGRTVLSLIHAEDVAACILKSMTSPSPTGSIYYVDDGHLYTTQEFISTLAQSLSQDYYRQIHVPLFLLKASAYFCDQYSKLTKKSFPLTQDKMKEIEQEYWTCQSDKTKQELGWEPRYDWATGSLMTYKWYKEEGWM